MPLLIENSRDNIILDAVFFVEFGWGVYAEPSDNASRTGWN